jgi:glycosyltransferase involved in cell wall biosynthesis
MMTIDHITAALPPALDGIGDYTACLAAQMGKWSHVRVLTGMDKPFDPIPGVELVPCFRPQQRTSSWKLVDAVVDHRPDWVILQFNQFSFGRWGLNPVLPMAMRAVRKRAPKTRLAVMFHEDFVPKTSWKFRIMRVWQKWQFKALGNAADLVIFSIAPWVQTYGSWFGGRPVIHLPVGSNIPEVPISRAEARARLGIGDGTMVLALFGSVHPARNLPWIQAALKATRAAWPDVKLLYIGANMDLVHSAAGDVPVIADGPQPAAEVSRRVRAADIYLAPYCDGVSSRRTSMMTGLQHGIATVGTSGEATDDVLRSAAGKAFLLSPADDLEAYARNVVSLALDASLRQQFAVRVAEFYKSEFDWAVISQRMLHALVTSSATTQRDPEYCPVGQEATT